MRKQGNRWVALSLLGVMASTAFGGLGLTHAQASSKGKRNLTIGLGAVTAYGLLKHNKTLAIAGGVGTLYSYSRYRKAKKAESRREARRRTWYQRRYGRNWRNYYRRG